MEEDNIVQFVCFKTKLDFGEFIEKWEYYTSRFELNKRDSVLQKQISSKGGFKYVSQHSRPGEDFRFAFMKGRESEYFPDHNVKVTQAGGYSLLNKTKAYRYEDGESKIIVFVNNSKVGIDFFTLMPSYKRRNVYKAYFENCAFSYVIEFFVKENDVEDFILQMKDHEWAEAEIYKDLAEPAQKKKKAREVSA